MLCPTCNTPMTELLTSWRCDVCEPAKAQPPGAVASMWGKIPAEESDAEFLKSLADDAVREIAGAVGAENTPEDAGND